MYFSRAALALALALVVSCAKQESVHRVAVLRFENLSPAPTDQEWIGRAISEEVAGQLEGTRHSSVVSSAAIRQVAKFLGGAPERPAAITAGANRIVTGFYFLRNGRLSLTAVMESLPGGAQRQLFSGSGPVDDLLHLCEQVARQIDEEAHPPITGSLRALRSYALGVAVPPDAATPLFTEAIQFDPDFGPPYVGIAQLAIDRHDTAAFSSIFQASRARGNGIAAVDRALLNLDDADLHATPAARVDALAALVRITPADPFHLSDLADAELEINRYAEAAEHYRKLAGLRPTESEPVNRMGYALMYSGDEPAAMKAFQDFRHLDHQSANAMDSTGDGHFFFNHFGDAEQDYLAAYDLDPNLQEGTELIKAAWTRLMRNDTAGAIQLVHRYSEDRKKSNDELASYRVALVEELAGHFQLAKQLLEPYINSPVPAVRTAATEQIAVFQLPGGSSNKIALPPLVGPAITALLAKDYPNAVPEWRRLAEESSPSDWWTRTVYARVLAETGQSQESRRYARFTPIPQPLRGVGYDTLWVPWLLSARK